MAQGVWRRAPNWPLYSPDPKPLNSHGAYRNKYNPWSQSPVLFPCSGGWEPSLIHSRSSTSHGLLIRLGFCSVWRPDRLCQAPHNEMINAIHSRCGFNVVAYGCMCKYKLQGNASVEYNGNVGIWIGAVHPPSQSLGPFQTKGNIQVENLKVDISENLDVPWTVRVAPKDNTTATAAVLYDWTNCKSFGNYE